MNLWKRKLAAYLHDPPSKALDIKTHGERSDAAFYRAGFTDAAEVGEYFRHADHTGAAADRLPFPRSQSAGLACAFDGRRNSFLHPLQGDNKLSLHAEFNSAEQGIEGEESIQPLLMPRAATARPPASSSRWRGWRAACVCSSPHQSSAYSTKHAAPWQGTAPSRRHGRLSHDFSPGPHRLHQSADQFRQGAQP